MILVQIIVIFLYIALCLAFGLYMTRVRHNWQLGLFCTVVSLVLPGVGFLFLWICHAVVEKRGNKKYSELYVDENFRPENLMLVQKLDSSKETNYVAMEDALNVGTYDYRRKMIMELLEKEDTLQYLDILQTALLNEDTETSHYASTVIMELQRKMQEELIEKEIQFEKDPLNQQVAAEWEQLLYKVLCSNLYDEFNKRRYFIKYAKVSNQLLEASLPAEQYFRNRIHILLMEKNYTDGQNLCSRYLLCYPKSEDAILCQLECFIQAKDSAGMEKFLQTLSSRPVLLTQKTLKYIRIFRKG